MKIFGIKIFKEPEYKVKNDLIDNFIINLSLKEKKILLRNILPDNKKMLGFEYEIYNKEYKNILLHDEINDFFSYFKYLKLRDDNFYIFGHMYIKEYIEIEEKNIKFLKIGVYNNKNCFVRQNRAKLYDDYCMDDYDVDLLDESSAKYGVYDIVLIYLLNMLESENNLKVLKENIKNKYIDLINEK